MRSDTDQTPLTTKLPSSDGINIALHDLGGDGIPVLLCHATGFCAALWRPVAAHLTGWHAWAPDLRGHGDSSAPTEASYQWSGFADDVLAVVSHLEAAGAVELPMRAAGHSKGAAALLLAEQRVPGTFAALYCYEPVVLPPMPARLSSANTLATGALRRRRTFPSAEAAYDNFASKPPLNVLSDEALLAYVEGGFTTRPDGSIELKCPPEVESKVYEMGAQHGAWARLGEVRCPTTIAVGHPEPFGPAAVAPQIAEALPNGILERHDDLGHFGPMQDPATIAACIGNALETPR